MGLSLGCGKGKDKDQSKGKDQPKPQIANKAPKPEPKKPAVKPIPDGFSALTPMITVGDVDAAMEFYTKAFGAEEVLKLPGPDGKTIHGEFKVGDSIVMMDVEMAEMGRKSPATLGGTNGGFTLYVDDADKTFAAAVEAGAKPRMPPMDAFWGDRYGQISDPFGHTWGIATHKEDVTPEQMAERATAWGKDPKSVEAVIKANPGTPAKSKIPEGYKTITPALTVANGAETIEFYKQAFGATERLKTDMPDGSLMHAEIMIGDSVLMLSDEQPKMVPDHKAANNLGGAPVQLMIYTEDADKMFAAAIAAKATEVEKMHDEFWGDRFGLVKDPAGNPWGIATHKEDLTPAQIQERMKAAMAQMGGEGGAGEGGAGGEGGADKKAP